MLDQLGVGPGDAIEIRKTSANGTSTLAELRTKTGCGLRDRLIHEDYQARGALTLTLDQRMARLPGARKLRAITATARIERR